MAYLFRKKIKDALLLTESGFTLIEAVISFAILIIISGLGLAISMDYYRTYSFNYEENLLVQVLQKARSESLANIDQSNHGFYYDQAASQYVIFQGDSYGENPSYDQIFPASKGANITDENDNPLPEILFEQLSGDSSSTSIKIKGDAKESIISINKEGRIDW